jgi:phosphinothricin acetyltransferase
MVADCGAIAAIYNEGISERRSTFETELRSSADLAGWLSPAGGPVLVAESRGTIRGWARISPYSTRPCYSGVGEAGVYVSACARGGGLGGALAAALRQSAQESGYHKIVGKLFLENTASRRLAASHGFREVGVHVHHGTIDGEWRDVLVVELLLAAAAGRSLLRG